jgi:hypothetical protein
MRCEVQISCRQQKTLTRFEAREGRKAEDYILLLTKTAVVKAGMVAVPDCGLKVDWRTIGSLDC